MRPKTTLEQWLSLQAVAEAGSFHAAAGLLSKSHTTLIYAVKKLERQLDTRLVRTAGRRAVLTEAGEVLLRRALPMLDQARELEVIGRGLGEGWESELTVAIDILADRRWLYGSLKRFMAHSQGTSVRIRETSLSATRQVVEERSADIAIINIPVTGSMAEAFGVISMVPVIAADHPLASKGMVLQQELVNVPLVVVRDLGAADPADKGEDKGWLKAKQRITVDSYDHAEQAVVAGLGLVWLPEHRLNEQLLQRVSRLPVQGSSHYQLPIHLVAPRGESSGPAARLLYQLLLEDARQRLQ